MPTDELVTEIPGYGTFDDFKVYSGYVPSHYKATVADKFLHYIFVESEDSPKDDPLVLWFNGGPGCSSLLGFGAEHGPYVNNDGTYNFIKNEYSWNKHANMLYLEMPAGVGFSYMTDNTAPNNFYNDDIVASENVVGLLNWFKKFSDYDQHDFYVTGESYAGVYVPTLVRDLDKHNTDAAAHKAGVDPYIFNLKGFMIGNPVTNWKYDFGTAEINGGWGR